MKLVKKKRIKSERNKKKEGHVTVACMIVQTFLYMIEAVYDITRAKKDKFLRNCFQKFYVAIFETPHQNIS